jgi:hypothetical protein
MGTLMGREGHKRLHFCEQYLTWSQSRAHFLRHSKGKPHVTQIFGGNPFFVRAVRVIEKRYPRMLATIRYPLHW